MAVNLSFIGGAGWQFFDNNGTPLSGGKLYTYAAGTTTPLATYTSRTGATPNTNPIVLDSAGRTPAQVWATEGLLYKYVLATSTGAVLATYDDIGGSVVASDLAQNLANSSGSSLVGYLPAGTGAVATDVQTKLRSLELVDYAALRAFTGDVSHVRIIGTGIAGLFKVDASDTTSADNGGTIIVDALGLRWKRIFDGYVNAKWFGANGDGVADDTLAIQAAINSLLLAASRTLYIPNGKYNVSSTLIPPAGELPYSIVGDGCYDGAVSYGTRLNWVGGNDVAVMKVNGYSVIKNISVFKGNSATGVIGFDCSGVYPTTPLLWRTNFVLENLMAKGVATGFKFDYCGMVNATRLSAYYCTSYGFDIRTEANHITFNNCVASNCAVGVTDKNGGGARSVTFNGMDVERCTLYGLDLGVSTSSAWVFTNLYTEGNAKAARLAGCVNIQGVFFNELTDIPVTFTGATSITIDTITVRAGITQLFDVTGAAGAFVSQSVKIGRGAASAPVAKSIHANPIILTSGALHPSSYTMVETDWYTGTAANYNPATIIGENFRSSATNAVQLAAMFMVVKTAITFASTFTAGMGRSTYTDIAANTWNTSPIAVGVHNIPLVSGAPTNVYTYAYNYLTSSSANTAGSFKFVMFFV